MQDPRVGLSNYNGIAEAREARLEHERDCHGLSECRATCLFGASLVGGAACGVADTAHDRKGVAQHNAEARCNNHRAEQSGASGHSRRQTEHPLTNNVLDNVENRLRPRRPLDAWRLLQLAFRPAIRCQIPLHNLVDEGSDEARQQAHHDRAWGESDHIVEGGVVVNFYADQLWPADLLQHRQRGGLARSRSRRRQCRGALPEERGQAVPDPQG
mmetsp:Transcript_150879/g.484913  ORF Transcript_150879/g.484913 Transcript_150879/m.484913 type:complete len:214 (-) Transcript_150879:393-1034(-)